MRSRDVTIPLALWMCAAVCAHFLFGTGGLVVANIHDDRSELLKLAREASSLAQRSEQTFEVSLGDSADTTPRPELAPPPPPAPPEPKAPAVENKPKPKPDAPKPVEEKRVVIIEKKKDETKPQVLPEPLKDRRIAVVQHAKDDQPDNPTAKFVADQANHVDKETVATQTSHDRDDENPTPGGNHPGSNPQVGDSEKTRIAESEEHPGEKRRAPGERGLDFDVVHEPKLNATVASHGVTSSAPPAAGDGRPKAPGETAQQEPKSAAATGGTAEPSPDVEAANSGGWTFNPVRPGAAAGTTPQPNPGGAATPLPPGGKAWSLPGLGQRAVPGQMNTNVDPRQIEAIVGSDELRRTREADGERRKSEHRGSFVASNFERWRSAIENYVSSVRPGNQTALNTARVPFASYLNGMHNRIHPIFAESFLEGLDSLPANHPLNDQHLVTTLEIVLTKEGRLKRMGIVKASGQTMFDVAALDSVDRAQPFGIAPKAIISPDGNVYLQWEFHRDEVYACSTQGARPYILNIPSKNEEEQQPTPTPNPGPGKERGAPPTSPNDSREGLLNPTDELLRVSTLRP